MSPPDPDSAAAAAKDGKVTKWKNPPLQELQKYGLVALPEDTFVPTPEEQMLMNMYEVMRTYERTASRLREEAARARLAARDVAFQQKLSAAASASAVAAASSSAAASKTHKRKKRSGRIRVKSGMLEGDDDDDDDMEDEEDASEVDEASDDDDAAADSGSEAGSDDSQTLHERREAKLAALREEVLEAKMQQKESREDALREQHLAEAEDDLMDQGVTLKRKPVDYDNDVPTSSLIANITAAETPPHDFSKKLALSSRGSILFPRSLDESRWTPPEGVFSPNDRAFMVELENFDVNRAQHGQGNNTLAVKFMAPTDARRFSLNIAQADHNDFDSVLFHFNPRQRERGGQLVVNDKQDGIWGQAIAIPLSQVPLLFGQTACTLQIQVNGEGFDIFLEDKHCARLEHRKELPSGNTNLVLQFPSTDDYGNPENWVVYKVWWGNRPILAKGDLSGVAGVNSYSALHPRKLFISRLPKIHTSADVELRRAELERAFRKYGGDRGVTVIAPTNSTYAFVEMETERQADLALSEMAGKYHLNRARRSRHEALQEERAAKDAAKQGGKEKDSREWD